MFKTNGKNYSDSSSSSSDENVYDLWGINNGDSEDEEIGYETIFIYISKEEQAQDSYTLINSVLIQCNSATFTTDLNNFFDDFPKVASITSTTLHSKVLPSLVIAPSAQILSGDTIEFTNLSLSGKGVIVMAVLERDKLSSLDPYNIANGYLDDYDIEAFSYVVCQIAYQTYSITVSNLPQAVDLSAVYVVRGNDPLEATSLHSEFYRIDFNLAKTKTNSDSR